MTPRKIIINVEDHRRLESLVNSTTARAISENERIEELRKELQRATILSDAEMPADVVRMNSSVTLRDLESDETDTYTLVYPSAADIANNMLSILAPVGTAILGYRTGDEVRWQVPQGWRRFKVERVEFEPADAAPAVP